MCLAGLISTAPVRAELAFENRILELHSTPGERKVDGVFKFRNEGAKGVEIRKIKTSCGCTTARLTKRRFEPGESGTIDATFKYGFEKGRLRKLLTVEMEDGSLIDLEMRVVVKPSLEIFRTLLFWRKGEDPGTKYAVVKVDPDFPAGVKSVASDSDAFRVEVAEVAGRKEFHIRVTPVSTASPARAKIRVLMDYPREKPETLQVHARVR